MKTTIIYAHPWEKSYNNAVLQKVIHLLEKRTEQYHVIDLNADKFNPVMTHHNLSGYSIGEANDIKISEYQATLQDTHTLIFIFPIWWYSEPAILKGFIEKTMLKGFLYTFKSNGRFVGKLTHIKKTLIFTTGEAPKWYLKIFGGNYINKIFIRKVLKGAGINNSTWSHLGRINFISEVKRKNYLENISL